MKNNQNTRQLPPYDKIWLQQLNELILENAHHPYFKVDDLIEPMMVSRTQLYRKIKRLTGSSPNLYIRKFRLERAKELLEQQIYPTVQEVSWAVGFKRSDYFSDLYEKTYAKRPIKYLKN